MRINRRILLLWLACVGIIIIYPALLFARGPGTSSASFLKIDIGARPVGMGSAFCGIADDINAVQWNPGGLPQINEHEVMLAHNEWFQEIRSEFVGYAFPIGMGWAMGLTLNYLYVGGLISRDIYGNELGRTFGGSDGVVTLSIGKKLSEKFSTGVNFKIIHEKVEERSDVAYAADVGFLYKFYGIGIGAAVQNMGTSIKLYEEAFPLPLNFKFGLGFKLFNSLRLGVDVNRPIDNKINTMVGGEYWLFDIVALRVGYKYKLDENTGIGVTAGVGIRYEGYEIDYGFVPFGDLGTTHRISLDLKLGGSMSEKLLEEKEYYESEDYKQYDEENKEGDEYR